jgi:DNA-binding transcriptional MerR regulator
MRYADITYRQLDHWCTRGWITPKLRVLYGVHETRNPGSGKERDFTQEQADRARLLRCLTRVGIDMKLALKLADAVQQGNKTIYVGHGLTVTIEPHEH